MNDAKELKYQGMQPEVDVMPKVKYEDIPEERRKKWASHRGLNTTAPQYDWQDLYALERQKLLCMGTYFSHSRIADENGHFDGEIWLNICLILLKYIESDGVGIPYDRIMQMNIRNIKGLVNEDTFKNFIIAPKFEDDKEFYGRKIYVRKMERLYHLIRLYKTRDWWE